MMSKKSAFDIGYVLAASLFGVLVMTAGREVGVFAGLILLASIVARVIASLPRMNSLGMALMCLFPLVAGYFVAYVRPEFADLAVNSGRYTSAAVIVTLAWMVFRDNSRPLNEYLFGALAGSLALGVIPVMNGYSPAYVLVAYVALALYGILWVGEKSPKITPAAKVPQMNERVKIEVKADTFVSFWTSSDIAAKVEKYGALRHVGANKWYLAVDGRYSVQEVADYLESL